MSGARAQRPAAPPDVGFGRYEALAARSVFEPRKAPSPPKEERRKPPKVVQPPPPIPKQVEKTIDLTGWSYAGYVMLDEHKFGIVQHESSTSVEFLRVGDDLLGAEVTEVTDEVIRFKSGIRRTMLSRTRDFPVTPLDSGASGAPRATGRQRRARRADR